MVFDKREYLRLSDVSFCYKHGRPIIDEFALSLSCGDGVIVSGPTGSGKTSIINLILGRLRPLSGKILVMGKTIDDFSSHARAALLRSWGVILRDTTLLPDRSIEKNITTAIRLSAGGARLEPAEIEAAVMRFGFDSKRRWNPLMLSRGERTLLQLVMSYVRNPMLLIWDDPDALLDEAQLNSAMEIVRKRLFAGTAVLITTSQPERYRNLGWQVVSIRRMQE